MYTARYLGAERFGSLSFALAFTGLFGIFADLGLQQLTVREVARDKSLAERYLGNLAAMKLILVGLTYILIAVAINLLGYPEKTIKIVYLIALAVIVARFCTIFYAIFQAYEKMEYQSLGQILNSILMLGGAFFAISKRFDIIGFAYIYVIANIIVLIYASAICTWNLFLPRIKFDFGFWKPAIKEALPFGLTGIFVTIYYYTDTVMLSLMVSNANEVIGWYNAAYKLILVFLLIPIAYFTAIFPVISRLYKTSKDSLNFIYERSFKFMIILAIPIGVVTTLLANEIILLIFGWEYMPAVAALRILVWSSVFIFVGSVFSRLFESINRQGIVTKIAAIFAILNVFLNMLLIPKYSYIGASITTVITMFAALVLSYIWSLKLDYPLQKKQLLDTGKVAIGSVLAGIFIKLLNLNLLGSILLFGLLYFIVLCAFKVIRKDDTNLFKRIIVGGGAEK